MRESVGRGGRREGDLGDRTKGSGEFMEIFFFPFPQEEGKDPLPAFRLFPSTDYSVPADIFSS